MENKPVRDFKIHKTEQEKPLIMSSQKNQSILVKYLGFMQA